MNLHLSKRVLVRIITYVTALVVVLAILFGVNFSENQSRKQFQEHVYLQSIEDLYTHLNSIDGTLTKGVYCASPEMLATLSALLWRDAGFAKNNLASLPIDYFELGNTYKFISQVGDYAVSLSKKVSGGESMSDEDIKTLQTMKKYCSDLLGNLFVLQEIVRQGELSYDRITHGIDSFSGNQNYANFGDGFKDFEESLGEFPSLIYDGPFSDHIMKKEPLILQGRNDVSREQARAIAEKAAGLSENELKDAGDEEGKMPSYCFTSGDKAIDIAVTKSGGFVTYLTSSHTPTKQTLSPEDGIKKAKEYLKSHDITSMKSSYYEISGNIMSINFAYEKDHTTYYPDLIKVSVSLENGEIISFHQRGYLANHRERTTKTPEITREQAAKKLSPLLTVQQCKLAVIPTQGLDERFCYEFTCKGQNGEDILVYLNAETGSEEQILILLINENGTLTA